MAATDLELEGLAQEIGAALLSRGWKLACAEFLHGRLDREGAHGYSRQLRVVWLGACDLRQRRQGRAA